MKEGRTAHEISQRSRGVGPGLLLFILQDLHDPRYRGSQGRVQHVGMKGRIAQSKAGELAGILILILAQGHHSVQQPAGLRVSAPRIAL